MHFHTSDRAFFPLYSLLSFCFTSQISSVLNCVVIYPVRGINQSHQPVKTAFLKSQKTGQCPLISTGGQRYTKIRFIKYDVAFHRSLFHKSAVDTFFKMEQVRCFRDSLRRHLQSSSVQTGDRTINRLSIHIPKQAALHIQPVHLQRHTGGILFRQAMKRSKFFFITVRAPCSWLSVSFSFRKLSIRCRISFARLA